MTDPKVIVVVKNGLLKAALRQLVNNYVVDDSILFTDNITDCIHGTIMPQALIIESGLLPYPVSYNLEKLKSKNPDIRILLIESGSIDETVKVFAHSILLKKDDEPVVLSKLKTFFDIGDNKPESAKDEDVLSEREREIVQLVAQGKTNNEISDILFISPHTVITHRKNIASKLGIKTIAGLTVYAMLNGLIDIN